MLPKFPHENTTVLHLQEAVVNDLIARSFGCFKMLGAPDGRLVLHQVLHVARLDADWYTVTTINTETGDLSTWQCGVWTPVYVMRKGD